MGVMRSRESMAESRESKVDRFIRVASMREATLSILCSRRVRIVPEGPMVTSRIMRVDGCPAREGTASVKRSIRC